MIPIICSLPHLWLFVVRCSLFVVHCSLSVFRGAWCSGAGRLVWGLVVSSGLGSFHNLENKEIELVN
jgi:hypothetical protein